MMRKLMNDGFTGGAAGVPRGVVRVRAEMTYGDGRPIERGDVVYIPGESALRTYRVVGYDVEQRMVCLSTMDGMHLCRVPPRAVSRW